MFDKYNIIVKTSFIHLQKGEKMKYIFPAFMIVYGLFHFLSLFVKYPGFFGYLFDSDKILGIFIFFPQKIRSAMSKIVIGSLSVGLGIFLFVILSRTP